MTKIGVYMDVKGYFWSTSDFPLVEQEAMVKFMVMERLNGLLRQLSVVVELVPIKDSITVREVIGGS